MNKVHPKKLLHSKWTAVLPMRKEKHFLIADVEFAEDGTVATCVLEAVRTKRTMQIDWRELKDTGRWRQGWC